MSAILREDGPHLGGLAALFYAPLAALPTLPDVDPDGVTLLGDLVLATGTDWSQLQGNIYSAALDVEAAPGPHGPTYAHKLTGFIGGDRPEVAAQLRRMQGRRHVLLYRDFEGLVRLVGEARGGLLFTHKLATATKPGDRKGYTWSFEGVTPGPALFYAGARPAELEAPDVAAPAGGSGTVELRTAGGQLLATVPAGKTIVLKSDFHLSFTIEP